MSQAGDLKIIFVNIKVVPSQDSLNRRLASYRPKITGMKLSPLVQSVDLKINKLHN
jgi:hypothetical protein